MTRRDASECRILLVRHASAEGQGRFLGQQDAPLSIEGRRQLPALAALLRSLTIAEIYCSDLARARATAAAVARRWRLSPTTRPQLRERDFGRWQGLSWDEITARSPMGAKRWLRGSTSIPGGEPMPRFKHRVDQELARIVARHPDQCIAVVTHAGVIRTALGSALGMPDRNLFRIAVPPCSVCVIDYFREAAILRSIGGLEVSTRRSVL